MSFASPHFWYFLALVLTALGLERASGADSALRGRKLILLIASCAFYAAWNWRYLGLLLAIAGIDWVSARNIEASRSPAGRKLWLIVSLGSNLAMLGFFKYFGFFLDSLRELTGWPMFFAPVLLPAGISFYTFKTMSYTIDVYRGKLAACSSWLDYATFVTFFPELIAGPIVRASVFLPQLGRDIGPERSRLVSGGSIFLQGLTKKLMIADRLAPGVDAVFAHPHVYSSLSVWCATLGFTLQLYADFSGYSDMAVGSARMIGYDLPRNFRRPYLSVNITELWQRWHITLSHWLRDYVYASLKGARRGEGRARRNLFLTMLLAGLWHGASWNCLLWGAIQGLALVVHRVARQSRLKIPRFCGWLLTFSFFSTSLVLARSTSLAQAGALYAKMLGWQGDGVDYVSVWLAVSFALVAVGHIVTGLAENDWWLGVLAWFGVSRDRNAISGTYLIFTHTTVLGAYVLTVWTSLLLFYSAPHATPFIYFQF